MGAKKKLRKQTRYPRAIDQNKEQSQLEIQEE